MLDAAARLFTGYSDFHRAYLAYLNSALAPYGLSSPHLAVLRRLRREEPLSLAGLAQAHGVEAPTMTALVQKLSAKGLLAVAEAETDRRQKLVKLTAQGRDLCERASRVVDALHAVLLRGFSAPEIESAAQLFAAMRRNLANLPRGLSHEPH